MSEAEGSVEPKASRRHLHVPNPNEFYGCLRDKIQEVQSRERCREISALRSRRGYARKDRKHKTLTLRLEPRDWQILMRVYNRKSIYSKSANLPRKLDLQEMAVIPIVRDQPLGLNNIALASNTEARAVSYSLGRAEPDESDDESVIPTLAHVRNAKSFTVDQQVMATEHLNRFNQYRGDYQKVFEFCMQKAVEAYFGDMPLAEVDRIRALSESLSTLPDDPDRLNDESEPVEVTETRKRELEAKKNTRGKRRRVEVESSDESEEESSEDEDFMEDQPEVAEALRY